MFSVHGLDGSERPFVNDHRCATITTNRRTGAIGGRGRRRRGHRRCRHDAPNPRPIRKPSERTYGHARHVDADSPAAPVAQVTAGGAGPNAQGGRPVGGAHHARPAGWPVGCKSPVGAANQQGQGQPAVGGQSGPHGQTSGQGHGSLMVSPPCGSRRLQRGRVPPGREARPPARHWRAGRRRGVRRDARRRGRTRAGRSDGSTCSTGFRRPIGRARRTI